jgi:site-specific DNA recombinase
MEAAEIKASDIARTMENFDNLWSTLSPKEQWHVLSMLIQRVEFDATESSFEIFFEDAGIAALSHAAEGSAR